jgi:hypothetical protein
LSLLHCNKTREITVFSLWQVISAIDCANNYDPVTVDYDPVTVDYDPITVDYDPVTVNYDPVTVDYDPVAVDRNVWQVMIPLLRVESGKRKWFSLKDKNMRQRAKGTNPQILLEMFLFWNP